MRTILRLALPALALFFVANAASADDGYPRRSWHPAPAPPCQPPAPPPAPPCPPPPCQPPPCPPPRTRVVEQPPCLPPPPPCPPPAREPCDTPPAPCDETCVKMADSTCPVFSFRARYWRAKPTGDVFITKGGVAGSATTVDLKDDMGLDSGSEWTAGVDVRFGRHRVRAAYEPLAFDGKNTLDSAVKFHGATYPAATTVKSNVDLTLYELGYQYALVDECNDTIWTGLSGWVWTFHGKMKEPRISESRSFTHIYPVATVAGEHRFGTDWKLMGGVNFGGVGTDQFVLDLEAGVGAKFFGHLGVEVGYRFMRFDFHTSTNKASMNFSGPFAELSYDF